MRTVSRTTFTTVKTEGGILPADLLQRVADGQDLEGLRPEDYHLLPKERLNEAITRAWNRCLSAWSSFNQQREDLPTSDRGTTLTRERWLLVLFQEMGYGRLPFVSSLSVNGAAYPISHEWGRAPLNLVTFRQDLDRRGEARGATTRSPHSLLQEFLNRSDDHLWGFVSNGLQLRVLRDNVSLTRAAYVEFDLEAMMVGQHYADFALLWLLCHQSRVEGEVPKECWLERWSQAAEQQGVRVLDDLRDGVQEAIVALGSGFLAHRANAALRQRLQSGQLSIQDFYRQLLRLVYRLIFLFVAEDRDLLLVPGTADEVQRRYLDYYSVQRLRTLAEARRGGPHTDLYRSLRLLFELLREGYPPLGLPGLGSFLFSAQATPDLDAADLANSDLLDTVRALAFSVEGRVRRTVDYRNLGSEELGSVYESLLELHPRLNVDAATFELTVAAGSERKTTGSYYTPTSLILSLLDSALEPVVEDRLRQAGLDAAAREAALLDIKVVDPACGSGHFLIAAAHRLARHLARVRTGEEEPAPAQLRRALRQVVSRCIHGVDINPMAVELCKVALWMETLDPGKPLGFLDRNIQYGNSLIGVTPGLDISNVPDDAFQPVTGDHRGTATALRRRNRNEQRGEMHFLRELFGVEVDSEAGELESALAEVEAIPEEDLQDVALKALYYEDYLGSEAYRRKRDEYDLWTSAFFWPIPEDDAELMLAPTQADLEKRRQYWTENDALTGRARQIAEENRFFHWELAFPTVFGREASGFDVVLGNPPWDQIQTDPREFFAVSAPRVANAANMATRNRMIQRLMKEDPHLYAAYEKEQRRVDWIKEFVHRSRRFPLTSYGRLNSAPAFAELSCHIVGASGRVGIIVPTGIATDSFNQYFFQDIMQRRSLVSLYDFENRKALFPAVHRMYKFCLLTLTGTERPARQGAELVFYAQDVADLKEEQRRFTLTAEEIALLNPNTRTCPIFRSQRDAKLTKAIYRRVPVLIKEGSPEENPWGVSFMLMFMMNTHSHLFHTREQLEADGWRLESNRFLRGDEVCLPLYEGKMFWHFDHRYGTFEGVQSRVHSHLPAVTAGQHADAWFVTQPWYWVDRTEVENRLDRTPDWLLALRDITNVGNERTGIFSVIPVAAVGNNAPLLFVSDRHSRIAAQLAASLNSFAFDFCARFGVGGTHMNFYILKQLPVLPPSTYAKSCPWAGIQMQRTYHDCLIPRVLELTYTAWDLQPFARDCGYDGPPFRWDEERRFLLRCELDAAYFHLYGIERDDVDYIMETFPIVKRKDEAAHGEYRTKRVILEIYDAMQKAMDSGEPYQTRLDPPPADPRVAHQGKEER